MAENGTDEMRLPARLVHSNFCLRLLWFGVIVVSLLHFVVFITENFGYHEITVVQPAQVHQSNIFYFNVLNAEPPVDAVDEIKNNNVDYPNEGDRVAVVYKAGKQLNEDRHDGNTADGFKKEFVEEDVIEYRAEMNTGLQEHKDDHGEDKLAPVTVDPREEFKAKLRKLAEEEKEERKEIEEKRQNEMNAVNRTDLKQGFEDVERYSGTTTRPLLCDKCFKVNFTFKSGFNICKSPDGSPAQVDVFILIPTAYTHMRQRNTLRSTWLTRTWKNTAKVRYAFIMGETSNTQMKKYVDKENSHYSDIIVANFTDSYSNLTHKTLAGFRWVQTYCGQVKVVMKSDDDMYINVENLIGLASRYPGLLNTHVVGSCKKQAPIRIKKSHNYIPYSLYSLNEYPSTCSGTAYVTGMRVIDQILQVSPDIPYFPLEDVYVAFCLQAAGLKTRRNQGFLNALPVSTPLCLFKGKLVISGHIRDWRKIKEIWELDCS